MVARNVAVRLGRRGRREVRAERRLHVRRMAVVHQPPREVRTRQHLAVCVFGDLVARDVYPDIREARQYLLVARVAPFQHAPQEPLEARVVRVDPQSEEMKLAVPLAWLHAQLDPCEPHAAPVPRRRQELLNAVAVVVVRERHHRESAPALCNLCRRTRPVARRAVHMQINHPASCFPCRVLYHSRELSHKCATLRYG